MTKDNDLKQVEMEIDKKTMKKIVKGMQKKKKNPKALILVISFALLIFLLSFDYIRDSGYYEVHKTTSSTTATGESIEETGITKTPIRNNFNYDASKNTSIYSAPGEKIVYLTFDDGPSANITPQILDILDDYHVSATFFVLGNMANKNPDVLKDIYKRGHIIANHGYSHKYKEIYSSPDAFINDVNYGHNTVSSILGSEYPYKIYRFPGGGQSSSKDVYKQMLRDSNYYYFDWNALTDDSVGNTDPGNQLSKAISTTKDRNNVIILMHDSPAMSGTPSALPKIIQYYIDNGYTFKTIADYTYN